MQATTSAQTISHRCLPRRPDREGLARFNAVWYYEPVVKLDSLKFRMLRTSYCAPVAPSLDLAAAAAGGHSLPGTALLQLRAVSRQGVEALRLRQLAAPGGAWRLAGLQQQREEQDLEEAAARGGDAEEAGTSSNGDGGSSSSQGESVLHAWCSCGTAFTLLPRALRALVCLPRRSAGASASQVSGTPLTPLFPSFPACPPLRSRAALDLVVGPEAAATLHYRLVPEGPPPLPVPLGVEAPPSGLSGAAMREAVAAWLFRRGHPASRRRRLAPAPSTASLASATGSTVSQQQGQPAVAGAAKAAVGPAAAAGAGAAAAATGEEGDRGLLVGELSAPLDLLLQWETAGAPPGAAPRTGFHALYQQR